MKHYISVYKMLLKLNFSALVAYRTNFLNNIISTLVWGFFSIISIYFLTGGSRSIFGWSRNELLLLTGAHGVMIGIFHAFFSRNFNRFSRIIHYGQLDEILLKPMDSQFLISLWIFNYTNLVRSVIGFIFLLYVSNIAHYVITLITIINFMILLCIGLLLLYSIWFIVSTLIIWFTQLSNLVEALYTISGMARFPTDMYRGLANYIFVFILPITLVVTAPTKALLQRALMGDILELIVYAVGLLIFSRFFWKFALRYYTSASG